MQPEAQYQNEYDSEWSKDQAHNQAIEERAQELYKSADDTLKREALVEAAVQHDDLLLIKMDKGDEALGREFAKQYRACLMDICRYKAEREIG